MRTSKKVSYCLGVYNEETLLAKNIVKIDHFLQRYVGKNNYEIIIVDNKSTDGTKRVCKKFVNSHIRYVYIDTKGFGAAFKKAYEVSTYEYLVFTAVDLPFGFSDFKNAWSKWNSFDLLFGSKSHPSSRATRGVVRKVSSYIYQLLISVLFNNSVSDTQGSIFIKKKSVRDIIPLLSADNAFFSTELALYAQKRNIKIAEIPVTLKRDQPGRVSRYKVITDGAQMFRQILREAYLYYGGKKSMVMFLLLFLILLGLSYLSFGAVKGLHLYFWRDDWTAFWFLKNDLPFYFARWILPSRHPGEFLDTFPWFYLFSLNEWMWQLMGVVLKAIAALFVGLLSYSLFSNRKAAILAGLLFASYFGGLEGFTWISARLSGYLILLYAITFFLFKKYLQNKRFMEMQLLLFVVLLILEPGRSIFFLALLAFYALFTRTFSKKLLLGFVGASVIGLLCTAFGRTMIGFKSSELVSPYAGGVLQRAHSISAIQSFWSSLTSLITGQTFADAHPGKIYLVGLFLCMLIALYIIILFIRRKTIAIPLLFSVLWILVFYFASWISDPGNPLQAHNRYFTIPAVGVVLIVSYLVSRLSYKLTLGVFVLLLCFNISQSQQAINREYLIRGAEYVVPLLENQESSVPSNFSHGVFIVTGLNALRGYVFDWSYAGGLPFALKRDVKSPLGVPVMSSVVEVQNIICGQTRQKYYLDNYLTLVPSPLSVDQVYAWEVTPDGKLEDKTHETRKEIVTSLPCFR